MSALNIDRRLRGVPPERLIAVMIAGGVMLAVSSILALSMLCRPSGLQGDLAVVAGRIAQVEALQAQSGSTAQVPVDAVCTRTLLAESDTLHVQLSRIASRLNLAQVQVTTTPDLDTRSSPLQPVRFSLDAAGDYPAAVKLLQALSGQAPSVLLDRVDLSSRDTFLRLHLDGRVYCRAPRTS